MVGNHLVKVGKMTLGSCRSFIERKGRFPKPIIHHSVMGENKLWLWTGNPKCQISCWIMSLSQHNKQKGCCNRPTPQAANILMPACLHLLSPQKLFTLSLPGLHFRMWLCLWNSSQNKVKIIFFPDCCRRVHYLHRIIEGRKNRRYTLRSINKLVFTSYNGNRNNSNVVWRVAVSVQLYMSNRDWCWIDKLSVYR